MSYVLRLEWLLTLCCISTASLPLPPAPASLARNFPLWLRGRFDHHQKGFNETLDGSKIKLSSAGLIYKHYGMQVLKELADPSVPENVVKIIYKKMYETFMEHIDGIDNGVEVADGPLNYKISTNLSARVGRLNPKWNADNSPEATNAMFREAMELTAREFIEFAEYYLEGWWPARAIVEEALSKRETVHPSGSIVLLHQYCPWASHLFSLEAEQGIKGLIKYVLYQDQAGNWRVQAVSSAEGSFATRLALPEPWRGLRDEALSKFCGIENCIFVHAAGFIGGNKTKEGAMRMAVKALEFKA